MSTRQKQHTDYYTVVKFGDMPTRQKQGKGCTETDPETTKNEPLTMASLETQDRTMTSQEEARLAHILKVIKEGNDSLTTQFNLKTAEFSCSISAQLAEIKNTN